MKDNTTIMCDQCKRQVPMSDAKYSSKGENSVMVVCSECRSRTKMKKSSPIAIKEVTKTIQNLKPSVKIGGNNVKKTFSCTRCNYKFKFDYGSDANLRCPYCGKADYVSKYHEFTPNKLLKEVKD